MPVVKKQVASPRGKPQGVISRIASVGLGDALLKINVYGRSGSGKTTFACTFPKKLLIIGAEDGTKSVHNVKGVDFVAVNSIDEAVEVINYVATADYKTVVLDSASSLQDIALKEILGLNELPVQRSWGMASREQWGQCALKTKEVLRAILNLPVHKVIIAQERDFNTEGESDLLMPYVASALSPSVVGWLNPACDYIVQTFIRQKTEVVVTKVAGKEQRISKNLKGVEYCLRVAPHEVYTTKFRLPKGHELPEVIVDPDYTKVVGLLK